MIRSLFGGITTKCRTVDKLDIFGDGSCKALYRLDGNANDESGNYHGTETAIAYGGGMYERGAVFNGSSSNITASNFKLPIGAKTLSFLVKSTVSSNYNQIINDSDTGISENAGITGTTVAFDLNTGKIYFKVKETPVMGNIFTLISATSVTDGNWHHIVCLWDGTITTNSVKIYIDGVLSISGTASGLQTSTPEGYFTVGKAYGTGNYFFNGSLDQVRIFNRAITATEVATLYAECEPTSIIDNINPFEDGSLKALYKFEDNANDSTGVYNGIPTNVTYGTGKFGKCAVFNGSSSKIDTATGITPVNFSFLAWVNLSSVTLASDIFGTMTSIAYSVGYVIAVSNNLLYILSSSNGTSFTANYNTPFTQLNTWTHISIVVNSDNSIKMYINGNQVTVTPTTTGVITKGATSDRIGTGGASTIHGSIDQLRIFNKALTPMEVASLYNETTPLEEPLYALVDPFKDGSGKALYRLDGNALDESGNYNGTPTALTYGLGRFGRCGIGNGSTTKVKADFQLTTNMTISCFAYFTLLGESQFIFGELDSNGIGTSNRIGLGLTTTNTFQIALGNGTLGLNNTSIASGVAINTWYHFALVISGTSVKLYKDSILVADLTSTVSIGAHTAGNFSFFDYGNYGVAGSFSMNGRIDQCRIFSKALSQAEVTALYNET